MKAAFFMQHGGPEVLQYGEVPDPVAAAGEVVVDIHAASVNAAVWQVRQGSYPRVASFPYILGRDFSGIVSAVGEGVAVPVRLCFDMLPEDLKPLSGTASFSEAWKTDAKDQAFVAEIVKRWRRQRR